MISKWEDTVMSDTFKRQFRFIPSKPSQDVSRWDIEGLLNAQAQITWRAAFQAGVAYEEAQLDLLRRGWVKEVKGE